ncbi:hypothetical protein [Luteolibacter luteus]|uniref:HEAT repeat domain-containing protein n=1 Tax=Luteolibacter luteus TaxID=2728835 RepID=A0A858RKA3_9BACT|nr:hypothetical protein [Luteolibacter luteus]QJE96888.1 hypothetical protein HHL09_14205 [Luteolibacter luteus]
MKKIILGFLGLCLATALVVSQWQEAPTPGTTPKKTGPKTSRKAPLPRADRETRVRQEDEGNVGGDTDESPVQRESRQLIELRERAETDAEAAWASALEWPEEKRAQALAEVCFGMAGAKPLEAIERARGAHLDRLPGAIEERLVQQWATHDVSAALAWLMKEPGGESRDKLAIRLTYVLSQTDPTAAAKLALEQMLPGSSQDEAVMIVVTQWANKDLPAANAWVQDFPEGPLQERAANELRMIAERR